MDINEAFDIVLSLATDNALDEIEAEVNGLSKTYEKQMIALNTVIDHVVNVVNG